MGRNSGPPQCVPEPGPGLGFTLGIAGAVAAEGWAHEAAAAFKGVPFMIIY